jgi:hypothetical protein
MHFDVPKAKTFKEFGGEYVMIVISILTALALEAVVEKVHHDHLAQEASVQIEQELRLNIADIKEVLVHNEQKKDALLAARKQMLADLRGHIGDQAFLDRFKQEWHTALEMSLHSPSLRREAWEAAVASQAVSWMPHRTLEKYANTYAEMRDVNMLINGGSMNFLDGPRMQDVFSNVEMGIGDPKDIFRVVTQMINAYASIDGNLKSLQSELEQASAAPARGKHG